MRPRPNRLRSLPEQYFINLVARAAAEAAQPGERFLDLGRGNPDVPAPAHVVERLAEASARPQASGYPPFRGIRPLREAIAQRYRDVYGVELDPEREVAVVPGTKTAIIDLAAALVEEGETLVLPDPGYPDYFSAAPLAGAREEKLPLDSTAGWQPDFGAAPRDRVAALYLNFPSNPCAVCAGDGVFESAVAYAHETGAWVVHDFAYGDLVYDGRRPRSFLATPGARDVGVEMFSMSKSYGMAGWRLGFVVGNEEVVRRVELLDGHLRVGVFTGIQEAGVAALTGPQDTVEERRALYERRRGVVLRAVGELASPCEGTFYVWIRLPEGLTPERLIAERRILVAPGEGFGERGAGWARISLAVPDDALAEGLGRLRAAVAAG